MLRIFSSSPGHGGEICPRCVAIVLIARDAAGPGGASIIFAVLAGGIDDKVISRIVLAHPKTSVVLIGNRVDHQVARPASERCWQDVFAPGLSALAPVFAPPWLINSGWLASVLFSMALTSRSEPAVFSLHRSLPCRSWQAPARDDGFKLVFRWEPGGVLRVRLHFAVMTEYQIDHIGMLSPAARWRLSPPALRYSFRWRQRQKTG